MSISEECSHRPPCPGCPRFGETEPASGAWQTLVQLAEESGLPAPALHSMTPFGHRHRARLAVRGRTRSPKVGLFQLGSHRIVDIPHCGVHHPMINQTVAALKRAIRATETEPYADRPHRGALRYVQIVVERSTERVQVVLVGNGPSPDLLEALSSDLQQRLGEGLQGLFFNAQPERTNAILGPNMVHLAGESAIREKIGGVDVFFPPGAFGQNHLPLFEIAVDQISRRVPDGSRVAEYYCGVGAIGLGLLSRVSEVRFNERSPDGLNGLARGLEERPDVERARAQILRGAAGESLEGLGEMDVVIVDPPRKGLDPPLLKALAETPPRRLIYLACGLPSLLEELPKLVRTDGLALKGIEAFDFFPFTDHLETLVCLDRNGETFETPEVPPAVPAKRTS